MFPLSFHKELYDYYNESIAHMCDTPEEFRLLQQHFEAIDVKCGSPNAMDVPMIVQTEWHKWAHTRTMNAGYFLGDSYKWEMDKEVNMHNLMSIYPPLSTRPEKETPNGVFPQSWPPVDPEEPEPDKTHAKILAVLVMDDYEHRSTTDYLSPGFPVSEHVVPEQRIRRAPLVLVDEGRVQYQERVLQFPQETINDEHVYMLGAREEARVEHNYHAQNAQRGVVRHPTWTGIDQYGATVHIYLPREMPDSPEPDWDAIANAQPLTGNDLETAVNERLMNILVPTPVTETSVPTANAQVAFSGTARRLPADLDDVSVNPTEVESKSVPSARCILPVSANATSPSSCCDCSHLIKRRSSTPGMGQLANLDPATGAKTACT
eukprot:6492495-Amphidinium_carterae.2